MTKFKSQALHYIRIKFWKTSGSGNPPSLISALQKIAFLVLKTKVSILVWDEIMGLFYNEENNFEEKSKYTTLQKFRHTRSLLETKVIIKILAHTCYPINFD